MRRLPLPTASSATQMVHRGGISGGLERLATTAFLRRVYRAELALLDQVARSRA